MRTFAEWCKFFQDLHANPSANISGLTIRDIWLGQIHVEQCKKCRTLCDEVGEMAPPPSILDDISPN